MQEDSSARSRDRLRRDRAGRSEYRSRGLFPRSLDGPRELLPVVVLVRQDDVPAGSISGPARAMSCLVLQR